MKMKVEQMRTGQDGIMDLWYNKTTYLHKCNKFMPIKWYQKIYLWSWTKGTCMSQDIMHSYTVCQPRIPPAKQPDFWDVGQHLDTGLMPVHSKTRIHLILLIDASNREHSGIKNQKKNSEHDSWSLLNLKFNSYLQLRKHSDFMTRKSCVVTRQFMTRLSR